MQSGRPERSELRASNYRWRERLKSITAISDEMRDVIETEWPDLEIAPAQGSAIKDGRETPAVGVAFGGAGVSAGRGDASGTPPAGRFNIEPANLFRPLQTDATLAASSSWALARSSLDVDPHRSGR
jgi:hypothetical protein